MCIRTLYGIFIFILCALTTFAGKRKDQPLFLVHTDVLYADDTSFPGASILVGNVQFRHGGMTLTCDSALYYQREQNFSAFSNVHMVQGDTLTLDCDEMYYEGEPQLAQARYNVILRNRATKLFTDSLDYDRLATLGYFFEGGTLVDGENTLVSDYGEYNTTTKLSAFFYNVELTNPKFRLENDTLYYNTQSKIARCEGPTKIFHGEDKVYTEHSFYYTTPDQMILLNRSVLSNTEREMIADSIFFDNKEKWGEAFGNVIYTDNKNKNMYKGEYVYSNDSTGYSMATIKALAIDYSQGDSLYMHADTFKVFTYNIRTDSVYRDLHGYPHMRAYRSDFQVVADSMVMHGADTTLHLYKDPILWQDAQQIVGEEIIVFMNDSTMDSVQVNNQAMMIERMDSVHYNQVKGHYMHLYFEDGKVRQTYVETNVYIDYYPLDGDSLMIGLNYTESSEMRLFFDENQRVDRVWMPAATGTLFPLNLIPEDKLYLEGFAWFDYVRPTDKDDIWEWRPKNAENVLKETVLHAPPLQTLERFRKK